MLCCARFVRRDAAHAAAAALLHRRAPRTLHFTCARARAARPPLRAACCRAWRAGSLRARFAVHLPVRILPAAPPPFRLFCAFSCLTLHTWLTPAMPFYHRATAYRLCRCLPPTVLPTAGITLAAAACLPPYLGSIWFGSLPAVRFLVACTHLPLYRAVQFCAPRLTRYTARAFRVTSAAFGSFGFFLLLLQFVACVPAVRSFHAHHAGSATCPAWFCCALRALLPATACAPAVGFWFAYFLLFTL